MSNHKSLVFFNKEGDYLNAKYNNATDRFEGDLLFHQSSSDTYKTIGLYAMEYLPAFEFSSVIEPCKTIYPVVTEGQGISAGGTVSLIGNNVGFSSNTATITGTGGININSPSIGLLGKNVSLNNSGASFKENIGGFSLSATGSSNSLTA